jgi:hypothetical protein
VNKAWELKDIVNEKEEQKQKKMAMKVHINLTQKSM